MFPWKIISLKIEFWKLQYHIKSILPFYWNNLQFLNKFKNRKLLFLTVFFHSSYKNGNNTDPHWCKQTCRSFNMCYNIYTQRALTLYSCLIYQKWNTKASIFNLSLISKQNKTKATLNSEGYLLFLSHGLVRMCVPFISLVILKTP